MEKNSLQARFRLSVGLIASFLPAVVCSQSPDPVGWSAFVNDVSQNYLVADTFLFQSFEGEAGDTWPYTMEGNACDGDASALGLKGQGGRHSILLPKDSKVLFDTFAPSLHKNVVIKATLAASELHTGDVLSVGAYRNGQDNLWEWSRAKTNQSINYRGPVWNNEGAKTNPIQITNDPSNIRLITPATNSGHCYCIDSVYAFGSIPAYSLFTGAGHWMEAGRWSHLPALRHRRALIQGAVAVTSEVVCGDVAVSEGSVLVERGAELSAGNVDLYFPAQPTAEVASGALQVEGSLRVRGSVTVHKTLPEKGKWFFISFPFDVYASGLDPAFEWKDDVPNAGGNYFYTCAYNGAKRASTAGASTAWEVMKPDLSQSAPLLRKHCGYLIALDPEATSLTLRFSSAAPVATGFGTCASIPIPSPPAGTDERANGWFLCGNPLPAPLPLRAMEPNPVLDGNVYVLEGGAYRAYPIGSAYALPPLSAFFVKAKGDTELRLAGLSRSEQALLLPCSAPLTGSLAEPQVGGMPAPVEEAPAVGAVRWHQEGGRLYVENGGGAGVVQVVAVSGCVVARQAFAGGSAVVELPHPPGLYFIQIRTAATYSCFKWVKGV